jgi:hypothetical protein
MAQMPVASMAEEICRRAFSFDVNDDQALTKETAASRFEPAESADR